MDSLYIVMPAYNEEKSIESVVRAWYPLLDGKSEDSRLLVADSGSTDSTHDILEKLCEELPKLSILSDTEKQHGPKVIALYDQAVKNKIDYVFQTDSDGQTNPDEFNAFWEKRVEFDGIFGNRTERGDGAKRAFVERVVCMMVRLFFGVSVPDANAPFRLMSVKVLEKYLYRLPSTYDIPNIMITTYFSFYKERISFDTISFGERQGGKGSVNVKRIVKSGWEAVSAFSKFKKDMKRTK